MTEIWLDETPTLKQSAIDYWRSRMSEETKFTGPIRSSDDPRFIELMKFNEEYNRANPPAVKDSSGLLPCPFCSSDNVYRDRYSVRCDNCGTEGPSRMKGEEQMDHAWNKRSSAT